MRVITLITRETQCAVQFNPPLTIAFSYSLVERTNAGQEQSKAASPTFSSSPSHKISSATGGPVVGPARHGIGDHPPSSGPRTECSKAAACLPTYPERRIKKKLFSTRSRWSLLVGVLAYSRGLVSESSGARDGTPPSSGGIAQQVPRQQQHPVF